MENKTVCPKDEKKELPVIYLLTTYYKKDKPASKYEPLSNTVLCSEDQR